MKLLHPNLKRVTLLLDDPMPITTISKGVAYIDAGHSRLPVMLKQLKFKSKVGSKTTWIAEY